MENLKSQLASLVNKNWFIMSVFFPLVMIYKMGLFQHVVFTIIFILLGILQVLVSLSVLTYKKEKTPEPNVRTFKKKMLIVFTAFIFVSINLFAGWVSFKTAQKELVSFDNFHLRAQFFFVLTNLTLIISLFVALFFNKLPKKNEYSE